jgi:hypothetical protein
MGLLDSWSNVVSAFLTTQTDLFQVSPDTVWKHIIDKSDHLTGNPGTTLLLSAQHTHGTGPLTLTPIGLTLQGRLELNWYMCTNCRPGGHSEDHCWILHPELRRGKGNTAKSTTTMSGSYYFSPIFTYFTFFSIQYTVLSVCIPLLYYLLITVIYSCLYLFTLFWNVPTLDPGFVPLTHNPLPWVIPLTNAYWSWLV